MCRGRRTRFLLHLHIQLEGRDGPAREPSWSAFWLQKPSILRARVREEDAGGREEGAHSTTPMCHLCRPISFIVNFHPGLFNLGMNKSVPGVKPLFYKFIFKIITVGLCLIQKL